MEQEESKREMELEQAIERKAEEIDELVHELKEERKHEEEHQKVKIVVHDEDAGCPGHQAVERHAVVLHEADELIERDAAVLRAGDAVAVQRAGIEPLGNGSGRDAANLGDLAGGKDVFHFRGGTHGILSRDPDLPVGTARHGRRPRAVRALRSAEPLCAGNTLYIDS